MKTESLEQESALMKAESDWKQLIDYVLIQLSLDQDWWWWLKIETQLGNRYFDYSSKYQTE